MICCCSLAGTKACAECSKKYYNWEQPTKSLEFSFKPYEPKNIGWICPRCSKVHAPTITECDCHISNKVEPIQCTNCGNTKNYEYVKREKTEGANWDVYKCNECGEEFIYGFFNK